METPTAIRDKAWALLWKSQWLRRFVFLIVSFGFIRFLAVNLFTSLLGPSVVTMQSRLMAAETVEQVIALLRDPDIIRSLLLTMGLSVFIATTVNSIASYGLSRVRLSAAEGESAKNCLRQAFSGFIDPFGMLALGFLHAVFVWWATLLIVMPALLCFFANLATTGAFTPGYLAALPFSLVSITAFYRYRQAWFLKASHCDWPAIKCLRESARMMQGAKWRCFLLDCSFWRPATLFMLVIAVAAISALQYEKAAFLVLLSTFTATGLELYLSAYIPLAQAIFHIDLSDGDSQEGTEK